MFNMFRIIMRYKNSPNKDDRDKINFVVKSNLNQYNVYTYVSTMNFWGISNF